MIAFVLGKRHARRFQRAQRIRIDRFKLKRRHADIELEVFGSREVVQAVRDYAQGAPVSTEEATKQARMYLREIVPKFNLLAYYRFGAPIARAIMHFLYRPVVERKPMREFNDTAPKDAVVVYLINHRSNADYVLVAHMLFKFISLSYAIGEWARVWPLNHLFKWFGGYFIRRRYREPLYHAVLSTFVQTITSNGVTQGIFIEGGLTRDGAFQKPKLGMLDYIVTAKRDPEFTAPLFLIPTAINYDRVLEDRNLTEELLGKEDRSTKAEKLNTTLEFLFKNFFRSALQAIQAVRLRDRHVREADRGRRVHAAHPEVLSQAFESESGAADAGGAGDAGDLGRAAGHAGAARGAHLRASDELLTETRSSRASRGCASTGATASWLLREKTPAARSGAPRDTSSSCATSSCRRERWRSDLFEESGVPVIEDAWQWNPEEVLLRDYYANSLLTFDEVKFRGWPERKPRIGEALDAPASTHVSTA